MAAGPLVRLGELRRRQGRVSEAVELFGRGEGHALAILGLGAIALDSGDAAGARNAAEEVRPGLVTVSFEQVLLWNPEVILTTDPNFWKSAWTDPRWRAVKAVEEKRVYLSPHLPFGWFDFPPGANRLLGVWWAGKLLYPETFRDVDLRAKAAEFHRLFYHREPTAAQLDALLGEPGVLPK